MFNVGGGEIIVILLLALIVLGPDRLPDAAKKLGRVMGDVRRMTSGFQEEVRNAMDITGTGTGDALDRAGPGPRLIGPPPAPEGAPAATPTAPTPATTTPAEAAPAEDRPEEATPAADRRADAPTDPGSDRGDTSAA